MPYLKWTDIDEIAFQLSEKFPELDPMTVRFTDLHKYVVGLVEFQDDAAGSGEKTLEAIQMAWVGYYNER